MQESVYVNLEDMTAVRDLTHQGPTLNISPQPEVVSPSRSALQPDDVLLPVEDGLRAPPSSPTELEPPQPALTGAQLEAVAIALEAIHGGTGRRSTRSHPGDLAGPLEGARRSKRKSSVSHIIISFQERG